MRTPRISDYYPASNYREVSLNPDIDLHFSYGVLVAIWLQGTTYVSEEYVGYSNTTSKHLSHLPNKVTVTREFFMEIIQLCIPQPPPQTSSWLLARSRRGMISTSP